MRERSDVLATIDALADRLDRLEARLAKHMDESQLEPRVERLERQDQQLMRSVHLLRGQARLIPMPSSDAVMEVVQRAEPMCMRERITDAVMALLRGEGDEAPTLYQA